MVLAPMLGKLATDLEINNRYIEHIGESFHVVSLCVNNLFVR